MYNKIHNNMPPLFQKIFTHIQFVFMIWAMILFTGYICVCVSVCLCVICVYTIIYPTYLFHINNKTLTKLLKNLCL